MGRGHLAAGLSAVILISDFGYDYARSRRRIVGPGGYQEINGWWHKRNWESIDCRSRGNVSGY